MTEFVPVEDNHNDNEDNNVSDLEVFEGEIRELLCPKEIGTTLNRSLSGDNEQSQANEILALRAIFEHDLCMVDDTSTKCFKIKINPIAETFQDDEVVDLWFCLPSQYPGIPPLFEIEGHGCLSTQKADKLYSILMNEACSRLHSMMIYDLINTAQEFVQQTMKEVRERRCKEMSQSQKDEVPTSEESEPAEEPPDERLTLDSGIDIYETKKYIGHLHDVLMKVPSHLKIQSLENIMRHDLVKRFNEAMHSLQEKYEKESRRFPLRYVTMPTVAFHGTPVGNVPNIVRKGLLVPGKRSGVSVAHGSRLGTGIYLSPYPEFSFGYCDAGGTVLVCAVLQGHVLRWETKGLLSLRPDCIFTESEMVIFNASHVLPCYVITLVPNDAPVTVDEAVAKKVERARETREERLKRISARSKKFLPYGFGAQDGNKLQIVDAADSDDDEEEFGDYQKERYDDMEERYDYKKWR